MIAIVDYGMGNLRSVQKAIEQVGGRASITQDPKDIEAADKIVLPGVGAMKPAMDKLKHLDIIPALEQSIKDNKPFLGICLGLQLLFDQSDEGGDVKGLGLIPGTVKRFTQLKVPHMGWNQLKVENKDCPLFKNLNGDTNVYFCHSYYVDPNSTDAIATTTDYGLDFVSSVSKNNIFGVQFHPEKSQSVGLTILKNFVEL